MIMNWKITLIYQYGSYFPSNISVIVPIWFIVLLFYRNFRNPTLILRIWRLVYLFEFYYVDHWKSVTGIWRTRGIRMTEYWNYKFNLPDQVRCVSNSSNTSFEYFSNFHSLLTIDFGLELFWFLSRRYRLRI